VTLTVVSVSYALAPVSADTAGGAEQILAALDRALVRAGHRSVVVAQEGSQVAGALVATPRPRGTLTDRSRAWATAAHQRSLERACAEHRPDLVHFHGIDFPSYRLQRGTRALATLHMPPGWYPEHIWQQPQQRGDSVQLQCVSASQLRACPPTHRSLPIVPNGVSLHALPRRPRQFALALGRICPEKNLHEALDAGTRSNTPVLLGGEVFPYPAHLDYFAEHIRPRIARGPHRFLGAVGEARKRRLLAAARCLLLPTLAPETSSLVAMEAMAAGCPVIAYPSGAIPEVIEDGVTGFLVDGPRAMAQAIAHAGDIQPEACQQRARALFSRERMVGDYFALYAQLTQTREPLHAAG
jgi:glycosyltransferase involved in cell wall biosynthesis